MDTLVLVGPAAVGKMTVGREVCRLTGWKLFHNHMSLEPVLGLFEFGSPSQARLVPAIRQMIIEEAVAAKLPGLVFTYLWDFDDQGDRDYLDTLMAPVLAAGSAVRFAELTADLDTRLDREGTPERLAHKASKRDVEASRDLLRRLDRMARTNSVPGELPEDRLVRVDTTTVGPAAAAEQIVTALGLPRV